MSEDQFGPLAAFLCLALVGAHALGREFVRLRQPKVIGEILTGILLGPSLLGRVWEIFPRGGSSRHPSIDVFYSAGMALLMFLSGTETQTLFSRVNWKQTQILTLFGTGIPLCVAILLGFCVDLRPVAGPAGQPAPLSLVLGIAFAVTSIPVIARIFHDMEILDTPFARLVLGIAVIEDIILWMVLSIATSLATATGVSGTLTAGRILITSIATLAFFGLGLALMPRLLRRVHTARWNPVASASPVGYMLAVLCAYVAAAAACGVSIVFAAFLAGFAFPNRQGPAPLASDIPSESNETVSPVETFSYAFAIPLYFVLVGYRLDFAKSFSFPMLLVFLLSFLRGEARICDARRTSGWVPWIRLDQSRRGHERPRWTRNRAGQCRLRRPDH